MKNEIICTICPRGCTITVESEAGVIKSLDGYSCNRGMEYARAEYESPVRILTTTVKMEGRENDLLPVRSKSPLPKDKIFKCMEVINKVSVKCPIKRYDVVVPNICETGVDIVATKDFD